ncbi:hypothetical protein H4582DRAFT_920285 [Lactarius indigo]|nr:hypothetical protein H4582DRAFT_920285 [Lactarius indigo]
MSTTLELNCLILGEDRDHIFSLKILSSECVGTLEEAIKDKNNNTFQHVDVDGLELWDVSIAVDDYFEEKISNLELESSKRLLPVRKLSLVFSDPLEDEHLHVVVRPPPAKPPRLELNCLMLGDNFRHIFSVKILSTETVSTFREAIKDKKEPTSQHVDARTLVLWQVSIPNDDSPKLKLSELDLVDENPLSPMVKLWKVFLEPPIKRHVHIVVKPPPPLSKFDELTGRLTFSQLETAQNCVIDDTLNTPIPSSTATVDAFIREQEKRPIWNGRASTNCGIQSNSIIPHLQIFFTSSAMVLLKLI